MASKKWRKKVVFAKAEAVAGTAEAVVAADAVLAHNVELTPLVAEYLDRELERSALGASEQIPAGQHASIAFGVEFASSGALGTVPGWGDLMQACGFSETIDANIDVEYSPVSDGEKTCTIIVFIDGVKQTLSGCRGSWSLEFPRQGVPRLRFAFLGVMSAPADDTPVNPDATAYQLPVIPSNANTPTFSFLGEAGLKLSSLTLDMGVETAYRQVIGAADEVAINARSPSGQITIDTPDMAEANFVQKAFDGSTGALQLIHGTQAGHVLQLDCPKVQVREPSYSEDSGVWQTQLSYTPLPNAAAGNDEVTLTVR